MSCPSPCLPPEIWAEIFEHVTFVPGLMDVDFADPFHTPTSSTPLAPFSRSDLRCTLLERLTLTLVCKTWHPTALPFLYRCVHIRRDADAQNLEPVLRRSGLLLGSYVRHLIVDIDGAPKHDWTPLAQCFPNLEILTAPEAGIVYQRRWIFRSILSSTAEDSDEAPGGFLRSLAETCGQSLLRLHVNTQSVSGEDFNSILVLMPRLRTLLYEHERPSIDLFRAPHLTFLTIHGKYADTEAIEGPFPSLRHAFVHDCPYPLSRFLALQGSLLTTLHLDLRRSDKTFFDDVMRSCPNIIHLILYFRTFPLGQGIDLQSVGYVRCLGIHVAQLADATVMDYVRFLRSLGRLDCSSPRVVRILNPEVMEVANYYLNSTKAADSDLRRNMAAGVIQVEDNTGRPMGGKAADKH
ncbi:hypothetical protein FA95DRAFT_1303326 [Auriscalpium vulgare]|uniref:Uncharacterized protein n=1 Tax=Auriscalpium vulgare TaxID=40419 RepID=A0ACB8RT47_9AGAM|nr:hypothetical protein FA95DRAFT_1303326 [Auriscalpium vulgare]